MSTTQALGGARHWFFPPLDPLPKNFTRSLVFCTKCGPGAGVILEEGPFELMTAAVGWSVLLNGKKVKSTTMTLEHGPRYRPTGKRRVYAECLKCGADVLENLRNILAERNAMLPNQTGPAPAAKGISKPPFKVDLAAYGHAQCMGCQNEGHIAFRPASRYRLVDATLRSILRFIPDQPLTPQLEVGAARKMDPVGSSMEIAVFCGHCGKPMPKQSGKPKKLAKPAEKVNGTKKTEDEGPNRADDLANEAQAMLTGGRFDEALTVSRRALEEDKKNARALLVSALAHFKLKNFTAAIPLLKDLKKVDSKFADANDADSWLGASYEAQGKLNEAANSFRAKLKSRPHDPSATLALARVLLLRDGPSGDGLKLLKEVARIPVAKERALIDPRLAELRNHPAVKEVLGIQR